MNAPDCIFIGLNGRVSAIEKRNGRTLWETRLKKGISSSGTFVTLLVEEERIYAHTYGELYCLDTETGKLLWTNNLPGLGFDIGCLATKACATSATPAAGQSAATRASAAGIAAVS